MKAFLLFCICYLVPFLIFGHAQSGTPTETIVRGALAIIDQNLEISENLKIRSSGSEGEIKACRLLMQASDAEPSNLDLRFASLCGLRLAAQFVSSYKELETFVKEHPKFTLGRFTLDGWKEDDKGMALAMFRYLECTPTIAKVQPFYAQFVKTVELLPTRDGIYPRAILFLKDNVAYRTKEMMKEARVEITVIHEKENPQLAAIYARFLLPRKRPDIHKDLHVLSLPKSDTSIAAISYLCLQDFVDVVVTETRQQVPAAQLRPEKETYALGLDAILNERYEDAYTKLTVKNALTGQDSLRAALLAASIAYASCSSSLQMASLYGEAYPKLSKELCVQEMVYFMERAGLWGKRLVESLNAVIGAPDLGSLAIDVPLPNALSEATMQKIDIEKGINDGKVLSTKEKEQVQNWRTGITLRWLLVLSIDPSASQGEIVTGEVKGTVKWLPYPLLAIASNLLNLASMNVAALTTPEVRYAFAMQKSDLEYVLKTIQSVLDKAHSIDVENKYSKEISDLATEKTRLATLLKDVPEGVKVPPAQDPDSKKIRDGLILINEGKYEQAWTTFQGLLPELKKSVDANANDPQAHLNLGSAYYLATHAAAKLEKGPKLMQALMTCIEDKYLEHSKEEIMLSLKLMPANDPRSTGAQAILKQVDAMLEKMHKK